MSDLEAMRELWHGSQGWLMSEPISKEELIAVIYSRTLEIRKATMERVRAESYNYLVLVMIPVVMMFANSGLTLRVMITSIGLIALVGPILGALAYKEYRLRTLPLGGNLRQSLLALVAAIDSTARLYMTTYMFFVAAAVVSFAAFLGWRYGLTWVPAAGLLGGAIFLLWAYRSGQAYVRRMFRNERARLVNTLRELDAT